MSAVALLALAFVSIAVVGTALAAAHDLIAAAIARVDAAAAGQVARPVTTVGRPRLERPAQRASPAPALVRVRVRSVENAATPGARA